MHPHLENGTAQPHNARSQSSLNSNPLLIQALSATPSPKAYLSVNRFANRSRPFPSTARPSSFFRRDWELLEEEKAKAKMEKEEMDKKIIATYRANYRGFRLSGCNHKDAMAHVRRYNIFTHFTTIRTVLGGLLTLYLVIRGIGLWTGQKWKVEKTKSY